MLHGASFARMWAQVECVKPALASKVVQYDQIGVQVEEVVRVRGVLL